MPGNGVQNRDLAPGQGVVGCHELGVPAATEPPEDVNLHEIQCMRHASSKLIEPGCELSSLKLVEPGCELSSLKLVEPGWELSSLKLVEPGCEE